ncbi:mitogen-activated protein kinase kinase kinase 4-like isoform X2 [Mizuhopecten yessoensis]|nr:mitogen-activated protein kinase kinase kinase 4-like isoform X2 [Mizuhopecten yessoensis]
MSVEENDADGSDDEFDEDSPCVSLDPDNDPKFYAMKYSITPPTDQRRMKREKSKHQSNTLRVSQKEHREKIEMRRKTLGRGPVNVIKERYGGDQMFSMLSGVDSDDNLERDVPENEKEKKKKDSRESKKKVLTTTRAYDRTLKRTSSDLTALNTDTAEVPLYSTITRPLDSSGRFSGLGKPSPLTLSGSGVFGSMALGMSWGRDFRRQSMANVECPKDRVEFYKIFQALIHMGSQGGRKDKDTKGKDKNSNPYYRRQMSTEQELLQERFSDFLWQELQWELHGYGDDRLKIERAKIPEVLDKVTSFKITVFDFGEEMVDSGMKEINFLSPAKAAKRDIFEFNTLTLSPTFIKRQLEALNQVEELLSKLDALEQLFPTSKAFAKEFPLYGTPNFKDRVKSLYLWLNITRDLCHKMKLLGKILGVQHLSDVFWPMLDFETPSTAEPRASFSHYRSSLPEILEPGLSDDEDIEEDEEGSSEIIISEEDRTPSPQIKTSKKVQFSLGSERSSRNSSPITVDMPETSTPVKQPPSTIRYWTPSTSLSHISSETSLDEMTVVTSCAYRKYVDKTLRRMGMNKMLIRFRKLLDRTLQRAKEALEKPKGLNVSDINSKSPVEEKSHLSSSPGLDLLPSELTSPTTVTYHRSASQTDQEPLVAHFIEMGLPSFRPSYLFLLNVFLEVIHEALRLRLEQRPKGEPSFLSIRPLLRECKDVLRGAVIVKQYYQQMVASVRSDEEFAEEEENFPDLEQFDDDMRKMLEIYFTYIQNWLITLQNLPEASRSLKNVLEQEWSFTKQICPHVRGGEAEAGKRFSSLASSLLYSIADFLDSGIDDFSTSLYDWTVLDDDDDDDDDDEDGDNEYDGATGSDNERNEEDKEREEKEKSHILELRHSFQKTSRKCKSLFNEARERASKALGFAKTLRKDLEIAADFNIAETTVELLEKLQETDHVMVEASLNKGYLMFIPSSIMDCRQLIIQLLNVTCGREDLTGSHDINQRDEGYLLMVNCSGGTEHREECPLWTGETIKVEPTADTAIALSHIEVDGLLLVVIHSSHLMTQRKEFEQLMGKSVALVNEQTSCHQAIAESLGELKEAAEQLQEKVVAAIKEVDTKLNFDDIAKLEDNERNHLLNLYRETMLKGYNFGFEYLREVTRLVTGEPRQNLGRRLVNFAQDWMNFVMEKCERGRGMRPKWASQGFDFLITACEPRVLAYLSMEEFEKLKHDIHNCISHVIGQAEKYTPVSPTHGPIHMSRSGSSDIGSSRQPPYLRFPSWPEQQGKVSRSLSNRSAQSEPPNTPQSADSRSGYKRLSTDNSPEVDLHDTEDGPPADIFLRRRSRASSGDLGSAMNATTRTERLMAAVDHLEEIRDERLQEKRVVGRKTSRRNEPEQRISARRVNFRWQRGTKIGEGQFGKVFSAVNMDTGELMAMKEMKFQINDHQALKEIADEITLFEGILHPNLVKYYGVEVHRDEMLVFMEYCDRGTLEEAAKMGLPEPLIRIYTKEILLAVNHLHDNNIVHRDIKGANIFLTSSGCLKLGDFGCSAKLKSHTTMPGEFNNLVGTTAYMAPEVITKVGHGRAADIWSLGCVVIEIFTGKRPWHEFDNNFQIMFKVGMGGTPAIPEKLSEEGKDFLSFCFVHDPADRASASILADHAFVKV